MNDIAQKIAIAEACGWRSEILHGVQFYHEDTKGLRSFWELPDYLNDLNAIHEAEILILDGDNKSFIRWTDYWKYLESVLTGSFDEQIAEDCKSILHIPAKVRAKALLQVIGKWTE